MDDSHVTRTAHNAARACEHAEPKARPSSKICGCTPRTEWGSCSGARAGRLAWAARHTSVHDARPAGKSHELIRSWSA